MTSDVAGSHLPESIYGPCGCQRYRKINTPKSKVQKWLSTRNGSPRRSAPGHPIAIASAAEPPDPMPCSLAVVLLPGPCAHGCHVRKAVFPGPAMRAHSSVRARAVPACGMCSCCVGERRESGQRRGCGGPVHGNVHGLLLLVGSQWMRGTRVWTVYGWTRGGLGCTVSSRCEGSGIRGLLGWCGVRWLFKGCCPGGRLRRRATAAWGAGGLRKHC
jgi:hypothetical protein